MRFGEIVVGIVVIVVVIVVVVIVVVVVVVVVVVFASRYPRTTSRQREKVRMIATLGAAIGVTR